MAEIIPNQDFKHEGSVFKAGKSYDVSDGEAYYFQKCGWVGEKTEPTGEAVDLEVHDGKHGHESEVK